MKFGKYFGPMLLKEVDKPFDSKDFLYEIKFDGIRAIIHVGPNFFKIFSRRGMDITSLYPELKNIKKSIKENMIFDGEIVLFDNGLPKFSKLQERNHLKDKKKIKYFSINNPVCFLAFDCLYKGSDLTEKSLLERKKILDSIPDNDYFIKTKYVFEKGKNLFKKIKAKGLEGIVAKRINSKYEISNRSDNWLKIKNFQQGEFLIGGYESKAQNAVVTLYLGEYHNKKFCFIGKVILGKKKSLFNKLMNENVINKSPFYDYKNGKIKYIKPKLKCKIFYLERTENNHLRQAIYKN